MPMTPEEKKQYNKEYYERRKKLKGRRIGTEGRTQVKKLKDRRIGTEGRTPVKKPPPADSKPNSDATKAVEARVSRLKGKVATLTEALSAAEAAYSKSRQAERQKAKESSDGKSTASEKQASQEYRDKHQTELKSKAKKASTTSSSGGSSSSTSSSKGLSDMSSEELGSRIIKIKRALKEAKSQLSVATQQLGQLAHSAIMSDPNVNENFARFKQKKGIRQHDSSS